MSQPRTSVIIPAHNEERVIGRLLDSLGPHAAELDVIVVPNGCTDQTAEVVRLSAPWATVVEIEVGSKIAALNAGDAAATGHPRIYLDADAVIDGPAVVAVGRALAASDEPLTAAPRMRVNTKGASLGSKAYHAIWRQTSYVADGPIGCGFYGLNLAARSRFDEFPNVIADDLWVERTSGAAKLIVDPWTFDFVAPRRLSGVVSRLTRATLGNLELQQRFGMTPGATAKGGLVKKIAKQPWLWPAFGLYVAVRLVAERRAHARLASGDVTWSRDETTRG